MCSQRRGRDIESVHWYMLPLLKWLASQWDPLLHEERLPARNAGQDSWSSLRATRFPPHGLGRGTTGDMGRRMAILVAAGTGCNHAEAADCFRTSSSEDGVIMSRYPGGIPRSPAHHPISAFCHLTASRESNPTKIAEPLYDVIKSATDYLIERDPESQLLKEIREANRGDPTHQTGIVGWPCWPVSASSTKIGSRDGIGSGLIFPSVSDEVAACLFGSNGNPLVLTGTCQAALMFGSVAPNISADDAMTLADWLVRLYSSGRDETPLETLSRPEPLDASDRPPWDPGLRPRRGVHRGARVDRRRRMTGSTSNEFTRCSASDTTRFCSKTTTSARWRSPSPTHKPYSLLNSQPSHLS